MSRKIKSLKETSNVFEVCLKDQVSLRGKKKKPILKREFCSRVGQAGLQEGVIFISACFLFLVLVLRD